MSPRTSTDGAGIRFGEPPITNLFSTAHTRLPLSTCVLTSICRCTLAEVGWLRPHHVEQIGQDCGRISPVDQCQSCDPGRRKQQVQPWHDVSLRCGDLELGTLGQVRLSLEQLEYRWKCQGKSCHDQRKCDPGDCVETNLAAAPTSVEHRPAHQPNQDRHDNLAA
jgi:hypothetical protein